MERKRLLQEGIKEKAMEYLALYKQARGFGAEITRVNLGRMPILLCYFSLSFCTNLIFNQWLDNTPVEPKEWCFLGVTLLFWGLYSGCKLGRIKSERAKKCIYLSYWTIADLYLLIFIGMDILTAHTVYNYLLGMFVLAIVPLLSPPQALLAIAVDMGFAIALSHLGGNNDTLVQFIIGSSTFALIISAKEFFSFLRITMVHSHLIQTSERDRLTGLYNRNVLDSRVAELRRICYDNNWSLAAAMVDIDYFKNYNDTFGHIFGDRCLEKVADCIAQAAPTELCMRYGGEEFLIFFANADDRRIAEVLEDMRRRIGRLGLEAGRGATYPRLTVSIGVASAMPDAISSLDALINDADRRLYEAKDNGRNNICGLCRT